MEFNEDDGFDDDDDDVINDADLAPHHYKAMLQQMHIADVADYSSLLTSITTEAGGADDGYGSQLDEPPICYSCLAEDKYVNTLKSYNITHKTHDEMQREQQEIQRQRKKKRCNRNKRQRRKSTKKGKSRRKQRRG